MYKKFFKEEDESKDIADAERAIEIVKKLLVASVDAEFDRESTREDLWSIMNILRTLKKSETAEETESY